MDVINVLPSIKKVSQSVSVFVPRLCQFAMPQHPFLHYLVTESSSKVYLGISNCCLAVLIK